MKKRMVIAWILKLYVFKEGEKEDAEVSSV